MGKESYFSTVSESTGSQLEKVRKLHGTAAPEPKQGPRTTDSGAGGTNDLKGRGTKEEE